MEAVATGNSVSAVENVDGMAPTGCGDNIRDRKRSDRRTDLTIFSFNICVCIFLNILKLIFFSKRIKKEVFKVKVWFYFVFYFLIFFFFKYGFQVTTCGDWSSQRIASQHVVCLYS